MHRLQRLLDVTARHLSQEPDLPEIHAEHGRIVLRRDASTTQERPVTTERDHQIRIAGVLHLFRPAPTFLMVLPDVDVGTADIVFRRPPPHGLSRLHRHRPPLMNHKPQPPDRHALLLQRSRPHRNRAPHPLRLARTTSSTPTHSEAPQTTPRFRTPPRRG